IPVLIASNGQLGTVSSSKRYKEDINDMAELSDRLRELRPVTFRYKKAFENGEKPVQFGLIAEEVADVFPELVVYNEEGTPETVKYHLLATILLNEFQKENAEVSKLKQKIREQQAAIRHLSETNKKVATLNARLRELEQVTAILVQSQMESTTTAETITAGVK
ncbi:MAG: tail fiber domain-containing protein, partial [Pseudomonadota bacterium]